MHGHFLSFNKSWHKWRTSCVLGAAVAGRGVVLSFNGGYRRSPGIMGDAFGKVAKGGEARREGWRVEVNVAGMAMASHVLVVSMVSPRMG
jgi:hypothetical protein